MYITRFQGCERSMGARRLVCACVMKVLTLILFTELPLSRAALGGNCAAGSYGYGIGQCTTIQSTQATTLGICDGNTNTGAGPTACSFPVSSAGTFKLSGSLNGNAVPAGIQLWNVSATGTYLLVAAGAAGASYSTYTPGYGMVASSVYTFTAGQIVAISVGQTPTGCAGSGFAAGGGATTLSLYAGTGAFQTIAQHTPIVVAGGRMMPPI